MTLLKRWQNLPFQWIFPLLFFCIGLTYIYALPHFESPDSITHIAMIDWVSDHQGRLPVQSKGHGQAYGQQASQPPLYYFLMMPIWSVMDTSDYDDVINNRNLLAISGHPWRYGNRNLVIYDQPHPPNLEGVSGTIYMMRVVTLLMSCVTVYGVFQSARTILPERVGFAILATSFTAFNPQFLFIGSSVSNDNLVTMLATLITWQMLVMLRDGFQSRRSILLAVMIALATIAKLNGLVLVLMVALAGLWVAYRTRDLRGLLILGVSMLGFWLVLGSWWYIRNLELYDELFGTGAMIANYGKRRTSLELLITGEWEGFRMSYWGLFGWFSVATTRLHYQIMDGVSFLSVAGIVVYLMRFRKQRLAMTAFSFLGIMATVGMVMLIWWTSQTTGSQGRLIFPYIVAFSLLMAMGLHALWIPSIAIAIPMMVFSIIAPFAYIMPEYDFPPQVEHVPDTAIQTFTQWEDITLLGYEVPEQQRWGNKSEIPITLYWQPLAQTETDHALFISLIDDNGESISTLDSYPGWGTLPTTHWQPNTIYKDEYILQIRDGEDGFSSVQLQIGWYAFPDGNNILPILENGEHGLTYTIPIGAYVHHRTFQVLEDDPIEDGTIFSDAIKLHAYQFLDGRELQLEWRLTAPVSGDWRVFAFVMDAPYADGDDFEPLLQKDASPRIPLQFLQLNEPVRTTHRFELPDDFVGDYLVYVGWYNGDTGERLTISYPANMYPLEDIAFDANAITE